MAKKKRHEEEPENQERWLLTYADLITLLLGLFVILYAMSQIDKSKYQDFASALTQRFGNKMIMAGHRGITFDPSTKLGRAQAPLYSFSREARKQRLSNQLSMLLQKQINAGSLQVRETSDGISINLLEFLMFESGKADIKPAAFPTLDTLTVFLSTVPYNIRVEGHTDNVPINTAQFPSNWQLSVTRAMNTGYYILQKGIIPQTRMSIAGYSEYRPVATNDNYEGRAQNRRVEIVILSDTGSTEQIVQPDNNLDATDQPAGQPPAQQGSSVQPDNNLDAAAAP